MPTPTYPTDPAFSLPVTRSLAFETRIWTGQNGSEQRSMIHAGRASWTLSYPRLNLTQRNTLISTFETAKGSAGTFDFAFLGTTFHGCYFDSDRLSFTESEPTVIAATIKLCQVVRAPDSGSLPTDFPALANGCPTQRPYTHERTFDTVAVQTEGARYTYSKRAASLRTWTAGGSAITYAEAQAIWDLFSLASGRFRAFALTDFDTGTRYTNCRFASDSCDWRIVDAGQSSLTVTIQQVP